MPKDGTNESTGKIAAKPAGSTDHIPEGTFDDREFKSPSDTDGAAESISTASNGS